MKDNFFDLFGNMLFGDDDDEFRRLLNKMNQDRSDKLKDLQNKGESYEPGLGNNLDGLIQNDSLFNTYIGNILRGLEEREKKSNKELSEIQEKIDSWEGEGITQEEFDIRLKNLIGEPIDSRIIQNEDGVFFEKTWRLSGGLLIRHFPLTTDEINENRGKIKQSFIKDNPLYHINNDMTFEFPMDIWEDSLKMTKPEKSLQEQLEDAVEAEDFELACILRDKIKETLN